MIEMRNLRWCLLSLALCGFVVGCTRAEKGPEPSSTALAKEMKPLADQETEQYKNAKAAPANPAPVTKQPAPTSPEPRPESHPSKPPINMLKATPAEISARVKAAKVPDLPQDDWGASDLSAEQIAAHVDTHIGSPKGILGQASIRFKDPLGAGEATTVFQLQDSDHFQIQYLALSPQGPSIPILRGNGPMRAYLSTGSASGKGGWKLVSAKSSTISLPRGADLAKSWPTEFTTLLFASLISREKALSRYVAAAKAAGCQVSAKKRVIEANGVRYVDYRIEATKGTDYNVQIIADATYWLPVSIRTHNSTAKGPTDLLWSAAWTFNQPFSASTFDLPAKSTPKN